MMSGITVISAALAPATTSIELYPGWNYWKDLRINATTSVGILTLPVLAASWSTTNSHIAEMDVATGRIKAKAAASDTAPATGVATISTTFSGSLISISTNVRSTFLPSDLSPLGSLATPANGFVAKIPVAIVRYLPTSNGTSLDSSIAGASTALTTVKSNLDTVEQNLKFMLESGSRFRAYKTPPAPPAPSLGYEVVKIINIYEPIPNGIKGATAGTYYPDYKQILERIDAASLVNTQNVKEIWIESYSTTSTSFERPLVEDANMSSQLTGDVTNNARRNDDLPIYNKSYTIYGIDLTNPFKVAARAHASQFETLFTYANKNHDGDTTMFARSFQGLDEAGTILPNTTNNYGRVGKSTRPTNTATELDFDNATSTQSDITDWNAIDPPPTTALINSAAWRDLTLSWPVAPPDTAAKAETQWYIYWMQSMPGLGNSVFHDNTDLMNNWWTIVSDWDGAKTSKLGLYTPATCNYTLGASSQTTTVAAGQGSFTVTTTTGCRWTATTTTTWIHLPNTTGVGNSTLNFTFDANTGAARTGTISIEGKTFTLNQEGQPCTYTISPPDVTNSATANTGAISVTSPTGCAWTAVSNAAFISITAGASGNGNGAVSYSVLANTGAARTGTVTVAGKTFSVNQGTGCSYTLNPVSQNLTAGGGTGAIAITTGTGCTWTAIPSAAWMTITSANTGTGNGAVSFSVAASDGTARAGSIGIGGQTFAIVQAVNTGPTITAATGIAATQNVAATTVTIATVSDAETPVGALTVTALTIPTGITIGTIINTNGTISAAVSASCFATVGSNQVTLRVTDGQGASMTTSFSINVVNNLDCNPPTVDTSAGDHKIGSMLIYNYYTSDISSPASKNTQIKLTNTSDTTEVTVRMSLIEGQTGNITTLFFCLPANQTINFLASEYDPSVTGYIIAVAVDKLTGCPVKANFLMGGAYIKLPTGHSANLPAIAVSAIATTPATCAAGGTTATINFDGTAYSRLPRLLAIDNIASIKDGNNLLLILNRIGGNLITSAPSIGATSGKIYDTGRVAEDFSFTTSTPQSTNTFSINFPRIGPKKLDLFIPSGQSGWMKIGADSNIGLTGILFNFNSAPKSPSTFNGGNNLQAVGLAGTVTLDIPVAIPVCPK